MKTRIKFAASALIVVLLSILLSGCATLRALNPFDSVTASDIEFSGKKTGEVMPLTVSLAGVLDERLGSIAQLLSSLGQDDPLGVIMRLDVVGEISPRYILCTEQWVAKCKGIVVNDTVHFAGKPAGLYWRPSRLTAEHFND